MPTAAGLSQRSQAQVRTPPLSTLCSFSSQWDVPQLTLKYAFLCSYAHAMCIYGAQLCKSACIKGSVLQGCKTACALGHMGMQVVPGIGMFLRHHLSQAMKHSLTYYFLMRVQLRPSIFRYTGLSISPCAIPITPTGVAIVPQGVVINPIGVYITPEGVNVQPQV